MICALGTEFARFFLLEQDGETATGAEIIGFLDRAAQP
jgi:hypothetical protein